MPCHARAPDSFSYFWRGPHVSGVNLFFSYETNQTRRCVPLSVALVGSVQRHVCSEIELAAVHLTVYLASSEPTVSSRRRYSKPAKQHGMHQTLPDGQGFQSWAMQRTSPQRAPLSPPCAHASAPPLCTPRSRGDARILMFHLLTAPCSSHVRRTGRSIKD